MRDRVDALGLDVTWFPALDGRADPDAMLLHADAEAFRRNMGRPPLPAEIGCYLSHIGVWERLVASDRKVALVLEDDVVFHDEFLAALDAALSASDHWDMLKLNCIRAKGAVPQGQVGRWTLNAYLGPATGFGAYLIKRECAVRLLRRMLPMRMPVDYEGTRFFTHGFRLRGLEPFPSHVDDGGLSTITGKNFAEVRKAPPLRRLGNYRMRIGNYLRRLVGLLREGAFPGSRRDLSGRGR